MTDGKETLKPGKVVPQTNAALENIFDKKIRIWFEML
jgi:hypothetical protein